MPTAALSSCIALLLGTRPVDVPAACERACGARYDLASVTKPIIALAVLALHVDLDAGVRSLLPGFKRSEPITVRQLIEHTSRLRPVVVVADLPPQRPDLVLARIAKSRLREEPTHSDLNFIERARPRGPLRHRRRSRPPARHRRRRAPARCAARRARSRRRQRRRRRLDLLRRRRVGEDRLDRHVVWFQPATKRRAVFLTHRTAGGAEHGWVDFQLVVDEALR